MPNPSESIESLATLGQLIRARRRNAGLTQSDLAAASGTSLRFISEIERGRGSAGFDRVVHVARTIGIDLKAIPR